MSGCIFNFFTDNCKNVYIFTDISVTKYKVIKKTLTLVNNRYKYAKVKINNKNSITIKKINYTTFYSNRYLNDQTYYNRSVPITASIT
jgi:hypothetical protein